MSRNGYEFRPVSRDPFINHQNCSPLNGFTMPSSGILDIGEGKWIIHMVVSEYFHNDVLDGRKYPHDMLVRGYIREDGFSSVHSRSYGGFQTQPFYVTGEKFEINCDFFDKGYVKAAVIDNEEDRIVDVFEI